MFLIILIPYGELCYQTGKVSKALLFRGHMPDKYSHSITFHYSVVIAHTRSLLSLFY